MRIVRAWFSRISYAPLVRPAFCFLVTVPVGLFNISNNSNNMLQFHHYRYQPNPNLQTTSQGLEDSHPTHDSFPAQSSRKDVDDNSSTLTDQTQTVATSLKQS